MKKIKKILLILTALFSMAFLAGCEKSAQIGTTLTLDKDFKGERAMHVEISKESFAENVTATMEDIKAIFAESCPEELTYEFSETENSYIADIHLAFDSEDDYYDKVKTITEMEEEPGDITISSSIFHSGISVSESFESKALLKWLSDALIEKQFVSADNENNIFDNSGCVVKYEDEEYPSSSNAYVRIDQSVSTELSKIWIKTSLNLDGTWNREISFYVPKASMDANGDAIKEFLEDGVAKGAEGSWESYNESGEKGQVYTIKAEGIPVETMEKLVRKAFHSEESTVTEQTETIEGESTSNLIRSSAYISENYDLSEFVSESSSSLQIEYVVEENGTENPSTGYVYGAEYNIDRQFNTYLLPTGINLTSKVTGVNKYNRTFEFTFEGLKEDEKEFLKSQGENLVKDLGKLSIKDKKDAYTLTFTVKGDRETVGKLYEKLFGQEMSANYAAEHKWMGFTNTFAYEEYINLSSFLPYGTGQTIDVNYELSFGAGAKISSKLENAFEAKGSKLYLSGSTNSSISVSLYGVRTNVRGVISMLALILGIASLAFFVILLLTGKGKKKEVQQVPEPVPQVSEASVQPQAAEPAIQQQQTTDIPAFCTGCGEKFENDELMFCTKCGKKRGE